MTTLDKVIQMQQQGISDTEISTQLQNEGITPTEINDSLNQAKIKNAVSPPENTIPEQAIPEQATPQGMQESITSKTSEEPTAPLSTNPKSQIPNASLANPKSQIPNPSLANPESQGSAPTNSESESVRVIPNASPVAPEIYPPQTPNSQPPTPDYQPQDNYYQETPQSYSQQDYYAPQTGMDTDTISEIAEQVTTEKLNEYKKKIGDIASFKNTIQDKVDDIDDRLKRIENTIDKLQQAIVGKIGEFGESNAMIHKDLDNLHGTVAKLMNPLIDNYNELKKMAK